jgi:hypothetical protein
VKRANRGFDINVGPQRIEVKARFVGRYMEESVHFDFGIHSKSANLGYCLLWEAEDKAGRLKIRDKGSNAPIR